MARGYNITTGTQSSVSAAAADTAILSANGFRGGATFYNDSVSATLYLLLGTGTASTTVYSVQIPPGGFYELPPFADGVYTGAVRGIWSAAVGAVRITEYT